MSDKKVRWGILSTANISNWGFIPAFNMAERGELVAVSSRDKTKAEAFAKNHDIPQVFDSYTAMLESDAIDAVYNPLPNSMHAEWTAIAAKNGKHVFCEKPLAANADEVAEMVTACKEHGVLLFEAFVFRCHPQSLKLRELLETGAIGELVQMQGHFSFLLERPTDNIRMNKELAGGSLMDVVCYPITFARYVFGREPVAVQANCRIDADYGVDTRASILLDFGDGATAALSGGFDAPVGQGAHIFGSEGHIVLTNPCHPAEESAFTLHKDDDEEIFSFTTGSKPFTPAIDHFNDCILDGTELMATADLAAGTLNIIAAVLESSRSGQRIAL
ncbi:MAG: Gfo/Idh/MocA family protein [Candidatus Latescibacterota bacterium]|jgi:xylose dehydrogenase (NAD/NADP)